MVGFNDEVSLGGEMGCILQSDEPAMDALNFRKWAAACHSSSVLLHIFAGRR